MKRQVSVRLLLLVVAILFLLTGCSPKLVNPDLFSEGLLAVQKDGRFGYINNTGKKVIEFYYDEAYAFKDGVALVKVGTKYNLINKKGVKVFEDDYDFLQRDSETGLVWYVANEKLGLMNTSGKKLTEPIYQANKSSYSNTYWISSFFSNGYARVTNGTKYGFIDTSGKVKVEITYDGVGSFVNGLAYVKIGTKYGYIDKANKLVIPATYDSANSFNEHNHAIVRVGDYYKVIDKSNKVVFDDSYTDIELVGNYYIVEKNERYFLLNLKGVKTSETTYDIGMGLMEGYFLFANQAAEQLYIYSPKNKLVMSFTVLVDLEALDDFYIINGKAWASLERTNTVELYNGKASETITLTGNRIIDIDQDLIVMRSNGKYGLLNMKGERIVEYNYDNILLFGDGYLLYELDGLYGIMTTKGKIVVEAKYTDFSLDLN